MPSGNELFVGKLIDVESLLLTEGGRERSLLQYENLLNDAGFRVADVVSTRAPISLIEAHLRPDS